MARYQIEVTEEAQADLQYYTAFERQIITSEIRAQLSDQPLNETKNRKPLRENPVATWELRIRKFRVFYDVDEDNKMVSIVSVGHKEHNVLLVRGKEVIV
jgi:addiction module RelE/StbE family toxin